MERKESRPFDRKTKHAKGLIQNEEGETTEGRALCDWQAPEGFPDYLRR